MKLTILLISIISFSYFYFTHNDKNKRKDNDGVTYNQSYTIGKIPEWESFLKLNEDERQIDSSLNVDKESNDSLEAMIDSLQKKDSSIDLDYIMPFRNFTTNRTRMYPTTIINNKPEEIDSFNFTNPGLMGMCNCQIDKDTISISMFVGLYGAAGFVINVSKNNFQSSYFQRIDHVKPFKANIKDEFTNEIFIKNKHQFLTLAEKPNFKIGQQLDGYLTFTSNIFFEQSHTITDGLDTNYVKGKLFFTCKTKKKTIEYKDE